MRDFGIVALEQVLVDAEPLIENLQRGLEASSDPVELVGVEALIVDASNPNDDADVAALGQKRSLVDEAKQIDQLVERAGVAVIVPNSAEFCHCTFAGS